MDHKEWLKKEVETWKEGHLINASQAQAILAQYGLAKQPDHLAVPSDDKKSMLVTVLSIIGAVLVGLGAIVFVASNWQLIPSFFKVLLLLVVTFGTYTGGFLLEKGSHPKLGHALLFLGTLFTGATLALLAQIFHTNGNAHWLILLWLIAIAPLSYGFNSKPILFLSLLISLIWLGFYHAGDNDLFYLFGGFKDGFMTFFFYGLTLYGIGYLHEKIKFAHFQTTYKSFGMMLFLTLLYIVVVSELDAIDTMSATWLFYVFFIGSFLTLLGSAFQLGKGYGKKPEFAWNVLAFISAIGVWMLLRSQIMQAISYMDSPTEPSYSTRLTVLILFHVAFFVLVLLTVLTGYYRSIVSFVNIGLLFFILYIGYFYFTTVFQYLPRSLALVAGGLILLAGGWYLEKKRRSIINKIGHEH